MATTIVHTIKASGGDYTSLSAWEAAQQRDLVAADEIEVAECYGFIDTTATAVSGWTTGVNNYIIIRAHSSAKATVPMTTDGSRYLLLVSTASVTALSISAQQYTQVLDIQVETTSGNANTHNFTTGTNTTFRNCVGRSAMVGNNGGVWFSQGQVNVRLQNCIGILINNTTTLNNAGVFRHDNAAVQYDNCTAITEGNRRGWAVGGAAASIIFRNCLAVNLNRRGNGFVVVFGTSPINLINSTNNASTDDTAPGVNARLNQDIIFANRSIQDYHLDWMDAGARGNGTDLSASPTRSFSDDFDGNTRSAPWNIGALGVSNAPNSIRLASTGNSNIRLDSTGASPINIR